MFHVEHFNFMEMFMVKNNIYISIIAILIIVMGVFSVYMKDEEIESYYQIKCQAFEIQNANLSKNQIVFIGDSITDGFALDNYFADLNLATYNRGIGGDTTAGVLNRLKVSLYDINPSKIVLMIGVNDINGGVSKSKILSNYSNILKEIKANLPNAEVYCMSLLPLNDMIELYVDINTQLQNQIIMDVNSQIKNIVNSFEMNYIDLFPLLSDNNNALKDEYTSDGIHLNSAGYSVWVDLIKSYLM